ncbi:Oligopeptide transport system permease protein OppC [Pseudobythopirellula maris]|uniref:Oligopeptide transport system permease protein OppC n=1 Tax=Pseudobythopirellula maris TaxID=2527991 RepID=A0A5C5ZLG9_9BACT|nr:ABC transporter permease [Pseudobythopirellula maris]TWT88292.1 Oligopeptide transport system permease protein OppC [Pseudobythopirellula maris]
MTQYPSNQTHGVSLTQDAWRRLRRSGPAMASLWTLVAVAVLAFLTPVLPLQPSDAIDTKRQFDPPTVWPLFEPSFDFDPADIETSAERLPAAREDLAEARTALATLESNSESNNEADEEALAEGRRTVRLAKATVAGLVQRPYTNAGFPRLDPLSRAMVRMRYTVLGKWSLASICGRDKLGRDVLSRIFWGARVSLIVGVVATLVSLVIGVTYGAISGYAGGWVDDAMMRAVDVLYSVPFIFVVIFLITVLGQDDIKDVLESYGVDRITIFYFVVGAIYWLTMARVVRGQVLSLKNEPFVEAARAVGASHRVILFRHIVPNLLSVVIVYLTLTIPRVILFEAFLSFLGLGVEPPDVSWGLLANEGIQVITPVKVYWWLIVFPSLAIGVTLFALNFLGDGLRDAFDPKLRDR